MSEHNKKACTHEHVCTSLLDLPDSLISSILRQLPTSDKCLAELVCKTFRGILANPSPGDFVWHTLSLDDSVFQRVPLDTLARLQIATRSMHSVTWHEECPTDGSQSQWLLRRIPGVFVLHTSVGKGKNGEVSDGRLEREQQLVENILPFVSGLLSPTASVHLELRSIRTPTLYGTADRDLESQFWTSMSTVLTRLSLVFPRETLREDKSAALCQLTRLHGLVLYSEGDLRPPAEEIVASIFLDLPLLEGFALVSFGATQLRLKCPKLLKLMLHGVVLKSFCGMPCSIRSVRMSLMKGSVPLKTVFPADSAKLLGELSIVQDAEEITDLETVRRLCLNGRLEQLTIQSKNTKLECDGAAAGAFSLHVPWQAVPHTLQDVNLDLPLDKGIPRILEQLFSLKKLSLRHSKRTRMHLDRPLDPFLAMPKLEQLKLESRWQAGNVDGAGALYNWSPMALRFLGLAQKRIKGTRATKPERSITLIY